MFRQIIANPLILFLMLMVSSVFLFAIIRFLMHALYSKFLYRWSWLSARFDRLLTNSSPLVKKYGTLGMMLFVAAPLPGTGVVSGTMLSWLAGFNWITSFLIVIPASVIENLLTTFGITGLLRLFHV